MFSCTDSGTICLLHLSKISHPFQIPQFINPQTKLEDIQLLQWLEDLLWKITDTWWRQDTILTSSRQNENLSPKYTDTEAWLLQWLHLNFWAVPEFTLRWKTIPVKKIQSQEKGKAYFLQAWPIIHNAEKMKSIKREPNQCLIWLLWNNSKDISFSKIQSTGGYQSIESLAQKVLKELR